MKKKPLPEKLNICMVANNFPILGRAADRGFLWPIARQLAQAGHSVTVLSWKNKKHKSEVVQNDVRALFLGEKPGAVRNELKQYVFEKFSELHNEKPFHIVHSIDESGLEIGRRKKPLNVAMTYDVSATQMAQLFSILGMSQETIGGLLRTGIAVAYKYLTTFWGKDRGLLNTADGVFVTSPTQKVVLERYYLYPEYRTYHIPYGIEIGDLSPKERSEELRKSLGIPGNTKNVVTFSDMTDLGEMLNLLRAFEKVAVKKPASRLIIVGHGPLKNEIEFEMLNLALGSKVIFAGAVSNEELPDYIGLADVFVNLSTRTTGFESSTLEAMAQEKIVIGSEVSSIANIIEAGKNGFLIRPADVGSLKNLLLQIFVEQIDPAPLGQNARAKVIELFDTDKMAEQTLSAYYQTLLKSGSYKTQRA